MGRPAREPARRLRRHLRRRALADDRKSAREGRPRALDRRALALPFLAKTPRGAALAWIEEAPAGGASEEARGAMFALLDEKARPVRDPIKLRLRDPGRSPRSRSTPIAVALAPRDRRAKLARRALARRRAPPARRGRPSRELPAPRARRPLVARRRPLPPRRGADLLRRRPRRDRRPREARRRDAEKVVFLTTRAAVGPMGARCRVSLGKKRKAG